MVEVFVKLHFDDFTHIVEIFILLLCDRSYFLVFSLAVVGEPASNLLLGEPSLICQLDLVILFQIRMRDIVKEPFLENLGLELFECRTGVLLSLLVNLMGLLSLRLRVGLLHHLHDVDLLAPVLIHALSHLLV